jgi:hypothetical protein
VVENVVRMPYQVLVVELVVGVVVVVGNVEDGSCGLS